MILHSAPTFSPVGLCLRALVVCSEINGALCTPRPLNASNAPCVRPVRARSFEGFSNGVRWQRRFGSESPSGDGRRFNALTLSFNVTAALQSAAAAVVLRQLVVVGELVKRRFHRRRIFNTRLFTKCRKSKKKLFVGS